MTVVCSERQGRSLQLQLEQTTSVTSNGSRTGGQTRQSRTSAKSHPRSSPYDHHQQQQQQQQQQRSRDCTPLLQPRLHYYTTSCYDQPAADSYYYVDESISDSHHAGNSLMPYPYSLYCDQSASPPPRDKSACAVHSSVIVRKQPSDKQTHWSCCEPLLGGYGSDDTDYVMVNGVPAAAAGYTSVIVTMSHV